MNSWQQPVSGEPSLGTGHWRGDSAEATAILDQNVAVANTFYDVTFSNAPEGAKAAWAFARVSGAVGLKAIYIRKNGDTVAIGNQIIQMWTENITISGLLCRFPLDSSKKAEIATNSTWRILVYEALFYDI